MRQNSHEEKKILDYGRVNQKLKTREALLVKANELLKKGVRISVEMVAKEAGISKATAYRYFSTADALKQEASLQLKAKTPDDLFADISEADVEKRIERLIDYHFTLFTENETEFRLFLSSVIGESVTNKKGPSRGGRRIALIEEALKPLKESVGKKEFKKMVDSLSLIFGIESITVLKDLCLLNNQEILETWKWMVNRIVFSRDK